LGNLAHLPLEVVPMTIENEVDERTIATLEDPAC
jgi:hypothetical protein